MGVLPPAGLGEENGLDETGDDEAGFGGKALAAGGVLTAVCGLDFKGFDGCFSFLEKEAGAGLVLLGTFSLVLALLLFFTVNSSSSLSSGSLKSSSLSDSGVSLG